MTYKSYHLRPPSPVQAIQYTGTVDSAIECGLSERAGRKVLIAIGLPWEGCGVIAVEKGDFIVTKPDGSRIVYKPELFHDMFEEQP